MAMPGRLILASIAFALLSSCASTEAPLTRAQGERILGELEAIRADLRRLEAPAARGGSPATTTAAPASNKVQLDSANGHAVLGRDDAPVTIVEFTDLQCPYCARFARDTFPQIRTQLIDTGQVRFVSRDLPLGFHAQAMPAAIAARCAAEQGKYWEYRAALFASQGTLGEELYTSAAAQLGLQAGVFAECRGARKATLEAAVLADQRDGNLIGITGTPSFIVGRTTKGAFRGERIVGSKPYAVFNAAVQAALATEQP